MSLYNNIFRNFSGFVLLSIIFFVFIRFFAIYSIQSDRQLPIEPDDAFSYLTQINLAENDPVRESVLIRSLKEIIFVNAANDNYKYSYDLSRLNNMIGENRYYGFTSSFIFLHNLGIDKLSLYWKLPYINQILHLLAALSLMSFFGLSRRQKALSLFLYSFCFLFFFHQLKASPFSLGLSLMIIPLALLKSSLIQKSIKKYILVFILFCTVILSVSFHQGVFLIALIISCALFLYYLIAKDKIILNIFFIYLSAIVVYLIIQSVLIMQFDYKIYSYLALNLNMLALNFDHNSITEVIQFNFFETYKKLISLFKFFSFNSLILIPAIFYVVYTCLRKNLLVSILFIFSLLLAIIGLIHYIPDHPGDLILYTGEFIFLICSMAYALMLDHFYDLLSSNKIVKLNFGIFFMMIFVYFIAVHLTAINNIIDKRLLRMNYKNHSTPIQNFLNEFASNDISNCSLLIDDELTFIQTLALSDLNIPIRPGNDMLGYKSWTIPDKFPKPCFYIGEDKTNISSGRDIINVRYLKSLYIKY